MPDLYLEALQAAFRRTLEATAAGDRALAKQLHTGFLALASRIAATYAGELPPYAALLNCIWRCLRYRWIFQS